MILLICEQKTLQFDVFLFVTVLIVKLNFDENKEWKS